MPWLQSRLERVWAVLQLPVLAKLDMVVKYTSTELSHQFEGALEAFEAAAAAVLERERCESCSGPAVRAVSLSVLCDWYVQLWWCSATGV